MIEILRLSLPMTVWLTGFSVIYALQGFSCSRHWPVDIDARTVLIGVSALGLFIQVLILLVVLYAPSTSRFVQSTATTLATAAVVAAAWTMMPVLTASVCP